MSEKKTEVDAAFNDKLTGYEPGLHGDPLGSNVTEINFISSINRLADYGDDRNEPLILRSTPAATTIPTEQKFTMEVNILDMGYVKLVDYWGSDRTIIEAARMSTNKGFEGWGDELDDTTNHPLTGPHESKSIVSPSLPPTPGDEKLLAYLYNNKHATPFEMAGFVIEVKAPIMVFREWHRHRTQSYNEMSARYVPLPNEDYMPTVDRIVSGSNSATENKQAQRGTDANGNPIQAATEQSAQDWLEHLADLYDHSQRVYELGLQMGVPKEIARLSVTVARYSRMRASANLRNWLGFLELRYSKKAQYEIRVYAEAVHNIVHALFPRTFRLYSGRMAGNK